MPRSDKNNATGEGREARRPGNATGRTVGRRGEGEGEGGCRQPLPSFLTSAASSMALLPPQFNRRAGSANRPAAPGQRRPRGTSGNVVPFASLPRLRRGAPWEQGAPRARMYWKGPERSGGSGNNYNSHGALRVGGLTGGEGRCGRG